MKKVLIVEDEILARLGLSQRARNSGIFEERRNANQSNRGKLPGRIRCCKEGNEVGGV